MYKRGVVNTESARSIYPTIGDVETSGNRGTGVSASMDQTDAPTAEETAAAIGAQGKPVAWWVALAVLLVALMYGAQRLGSDGDFSNLRMSAYNIFVISLAAIIGINLFKLLVTRFPVPGLSTVVLNT